MTSRRLATALVSLAGLVCLVPVVVLAQAVTPMVRTLLIDGAEHDLDIIRGLTVGPNGTIVAPLPREHLLRFFDASGKPLGSFGRTGDGPGEFRILGGGTNGWIGDTLWVYDHGLRRVTLIGPNRKTLRVLDIPGAVISPKDPKQRAPASLIGVPSSRSLLVSMSSEQTVPSWIGAPSNSRGALLRISTDGQLAQLLGTDDTPPQTCSRNSVGNSVSLPLCPEQHAVVTPDGVHLIVATPMTGSHYRLTSHDIARGRAVFSVLIPTTRTAIPRPIRDSVAADLAEGVTAEPELGRHYAGLELPKFFPPFTGLRAGHDGSIWVNDGQRLLGRQRWHVFDAKGILVRTVELPRHAVVHAVGAREAWVVEPGADGFENIARYSVRP